MHLHAELLDRFYSAFQKRDWATMASCYHGDARFSDPVFANLKGWQIGAMWRMLCERGKDLTLTFKDVDADDASGSAHWEAHYTFSATGQKVHNVIEARFTFRDGLIISHDDSFGMWRWASQALGLKGKVLGWLPPVQNAVRKQAMKGLDAFIAKNNLSAASFKS